MSQQSETVMAPMQQAELDELIIKHKRYLDGQNGGARAVLKFKNLSGLDMSNKNLSHSDFTGSCFIGANMSDTDFTSATFFACDLRRANLEHSNFTRADFRGAFVAGANLNQADLKGADLREGKIMENGSEGYLSERKLKKDIDGVVAQTVFTGARMMQTNLSGIRAASADFSDADLSHVRIQGADLRNVVFKGANLSSSDLSGSDLRGADLKDSIIKGTNLEMTETAGADFDQAVTEDPTGAEIEDVAENFEALLAEHTKWIKSAGAEGAQLDLSGFDLRHFSDINKYNLTAMKAIGTNFLNLDFSSAGIQSSTMDESDFRDCRFIKADLRGSSLKNARLSRCDFTDANLSPLVLAPGRAMPVNMSGASLRYSCFKNADMQQMKLVNADLSYADLTGCNLSKADMTGANLNGTILADANLDDAIMDDDIAYV